MPVWPPPLSSRFRGKERVEYVRLATVLRKMQTDCVIWVMHTRANPNVFVSGIFVEWI